MSKSTSSLQSLAAMAHLLAVKHELDDVVETAAEHACSALGAASVSISSLVAPGDHVRTIINVGDLGAGEVRWPDDETYALTGYGRLASALRERRSWVDSVDAPDCPEAERDLLTRLGKGSSLATAIIVDGQSWGEFYATRRVGEPMFDQDAIAYAEVLAAMLAAAVSRLIRETDLQELAFRDPLTGLFNRRALDDYAGRVFDLGGESSREVVVVAMDIDGLKRVNDTEGHLTGDQVIRAVAAALTFTFEGVESSVVARVGGDEFTILISGHDVTAIEKMVNVLCLDVAEKSRRIGLSAGIATVELAQGFRGTSTELFAAADEALYLAKRTRSPVAVRAEPLGR